MVRSSHEGSIVHGDQSLHYYDLQIERLCGSSKGVAVLRYDSSMPDFQIDFLQLSVEDQKYIQHCIKMMLVSLRSCETRLHSYETGNTEPHGSSVIKLIQNLQETIATSEGMIQQLIDKHKLPDDFAHISAETRKVFTELLNGKGPPG